MDANSEAIVRLAWSRALGLGDEGLTRAGTRTCLPVEGADTVRFISLFGASALVGPAACLDAAADLSDAELSTGAGLATLARAMRTQSGAEARRTGPRAMTAEVLAHLDSYGEHTAPIAGPLVDAELEEVGPLVSHDAAELAALTRICPPDDVNEAALEDLEQTFILLSEGAGESARAGTADAFSGSEHAETHTPRSCCGYRTSHGFLADLRVLTPPDLRNRGLGRQSGLLAAHDALDNGLIPQARMHPDNLGARRLARSLGFTETGYACTMHFDQER